MRSGVGVPVRDPIGHAIRARARRGAAEPARAGVEAQTRHSRGEAVSARAIASGGSRQHPDTDGAALQVGLVGHRSRETRDAIRQHGDSEATGVRVGRGGIGVRVRGPIGHAISARTRRGAAEPAGGSVELQPGHRRSELIGENSVAAPGPRQKARADSAALRVILVGHRGRETRGAIHHYRDGEAPGVRVGRGRVAVPVRDPIGHAIGARARRGAAEPARAGVEAQTWHLRGEAEGERTIASGGFRQHPDTDGSALQVGLVGHRGRETRGAIGHYRDGEGLGVGVLRSGVAVPVRDPVGHAISARAARGAAQSARAGIEAQTRHSRGEAVSARAIASGGSRQHLDTDGAALQVGLVGHRSRETRDAIRQHGDGEATGVRVGRGGVGVRVRDPVGHAISARTRRGAAEPTGGSVELQPGHRRSEVIGENSVAAPGPRQKARADSAALRVILVGHRGRETRGAIHHYRDGEAPGVRVAEGGVGVRVRDPVDHAMGARMSRGAAEPARGGIELQFGHHRGEAVGEGSVAAPRARQQARANGDALIVSLVGHRGRETRGAIHHYRDGEAPGVRVGRGRVAVPVRDPIGHAIGARARRGAAEPARAGVEAQTWHSRGEAVSARAIASGLTFRTSRSRFLGIYRAVRLGFTECFDTRRARR